MSIKWLLSLRLLKIIGISAFMGSIFSMIVIGRSHDFSQNLNEIVTSRTDILRIIYFVNLPGLFIYLIIDLFEDWTFIFKRKMIGVKWILNITVLLITSLIIFPASIQMVEVANEAISIAELSKQFFTFHSKEDIYGPINMILFLASLLIGLKHSEELTRDRRAD